MQKNTSEETITQTIGAAIVIQGAMRWAAIIAISWLVLSYLDKWISAFLITLN